MRPTACSETSGSTTWRRKLLGEVEHIVGDPQLLSHPPGVLDVGDGTAARVRGAAPKFHGGATASCAGLRPGAPPPLKSRPRRTWQPGPALASASRSRVTAAQVTTTRSASAGGHGRAQGPTEAGKGLLLGDAHGQQHRAGLESTAGARRPGRGAHATSSSDTRSASLSVPGKRRCKWPGASARPATVSWRRGPRLQPAGQAVPQRPHPGLGRRPFGAGLGDGHAQSHDPGHVVGAAAQLPLLPSAVQDGAQGRDASAPAKAPIPCGPPSLWPLIATRSASADASARSNQVGACTASVCRRRPRRQPANQAGSRARGWITPVSWFTSCIETSATLTVEEPAKASRSIRPSGHTGAAPELVTARSRPPRTPPDARPR